MNQQDTIRSWKDEEFRMSLTTSQQMLLPDNPAGDEGLIPRLCVCGSVFPARRVRVKPGRRQPLATGPDVPAACATLTSAKGGKVLPVYT